MAKPSVPLAPAARGRCLKLRTRLVGQLLAARAGTYARP